MRAMLEQNLAPVPMLDLSRQYDAVGQEIQAAIADVCRAGRFILGKEVTQFEQESSRFLGANFGVGCASGTDALWLAMTAAGVKQNDEVITTPFSFFATASSILRSGAKPLFADIEPRTFNLSPVAVGEILSQRPDTRAVLPVHLYGQCADWDSFTELQTRYGVLLIEDAAQAFGAAWNGICAGALGDAAAFSFYPTKNLSAWGDAGLVTTNSADTADEAKVLRGHGMRVRYFHEEIGWNSRLDTVQAAVLLVKLKHIAQWNEARQRAAARYDRLFAESGITLSKNLQATLHDGQIVLPYSDPHATHVWHQYVVRCERRDALRAHLTKLQIGSEIYYPLALHQQEALTELGYAPEDFPESTRAAKEVLALPIFPELREEEQERVVEAIAAFYR